jgi:RimJ/RimL family protein N-acetyltransferase
MIPAEIRTQRLLLRPPELADAEPIFQRYAQDADVTRYLLWQPHRSVDDTREFLAHAIDGMAAGQPLWAITRLDDSGPYGMIGLQVHGHSASMGYVLAQSEWGKGYMSEAALAVAEVALAQPEIFRLWAVCDVENPASARVMEKAGMSFEGRLKRYSVHPNVGPEPRDVLLYARVR